MIIDSILVIKSFTNQQIQPLVNNDVYFVVRIDDNSFKLSETNFKSKKLIPDTITITDAGDDHTIALINPTT